MIQKKKMARAYNKSVIRKSFEEGELIWKVVLPIGYKDIEFEKWSPNWERAFKFYQALPRNANWLSSLEGEPHKRFINGKYLKKYFSTMWEMLDIAKKN